MGKKSKQKAAPPHKSKLLLVDYDRTFDTLVYHIKQNPDERTRLWTLATDGFKSTNERGILIAKHHVPEEGIDGINENGKALRSPAELAAALEYWSHSRLIKDCPSYVPGRWDGRDGRPRGCPGSDCRYDDYYENAMINHIFPIEVCWWCLCWRVMMGVWWIIWIFGWLCISSDSDTRRGYDITWCQSLEDYTKRITCGEWSDDDAILRSMGIKLEIPAKYCARKGCVIC